MPAAAQNGVAAALNYVSKDGDQNFPGTLTTEVVYTLTDDDVLRIDYTATTNKDAVANFTNHSYFNLAGNGSGSVADKLLLINAGRYTPTTPDQIPTGEIAPVDAPRSIFGRSCRLVPGCTARFSRWSMPTGRITIGC